METMTAADHDSRCPTWISNNAADCTCRDPSGHAPTTLHASWMNGPLCGFDLETTSPDPATARIVTATIIHIRPGNAPVATSWLADPGVDIPAEATAVHHITTERARTHGRDAAEVTVEIGDAVAIAWQNHAPVVIFNAPYDLGVLHHELARHCDDKGISLLTVGRAIGPVIDPLTLDRGCDRWRKGSRKLVDTCTHYGVPLTVSDAHTSEGDALAACRLAWKIGKRYPHIGAMTLHELMKYQAGVHREWATSFGKYLVEQGKPDDVSRNWPMGDAT